MTRNLILAVVTAVLMTTAIAPAANAETYWETVREFQTGYDRDGR